MDNSNIYYRSLKKRDAALISALGPATMGDLLALPWGFGIGALLREGRKLSVVGVVVGTVSDDAICIEWMAVATDLQYREIGQELLVRVFDLAISMDKEKVQAAIHRSYLRNPLTVGCSSYFKERLFEEKAMVGEDIYTDLGDIAKKCLIKSAHGKIEPEFIADTPRRKRKELIDRLERLCCPSGMPNNEVFGRHIDEDVSAVIQKNEIIMGALITYHVGDILVPRYVYMEDEKLLEPLVYSSLTAAGKKYGKAQKILITRRSETSMELCEKVFGVGEEMSILTAYVGEYNKISN